MPELPEVETIRRELSRKVIGKKIGAVRIFRALVVRQDTGVFSRALTGAVISRVSRKGKLLLLELSGHKALAVHLRMTGQLVYPGGEGVPRVRFTFTDGTSLDYRDQRMLGDLRAVMDWRELPFVKNLGPEPFVLTEAAFSAMLAKRATKIKPLLLDQGFIAGIGNLYASEMLFGAKIHPERPARSLTGAEKKKLYHRMVDILKKAIAHKGSSLDQFVRTDGTKGGYVRFHQVYGRDGKPCSACRSKIVRVSIGGRGTFFCPACQRGT